MVLRSFDCLVHICAWAIIHKVFVFLPYINLVAQTQICMTFIGPPYTTVQTDPDGMVTIIFAFKVMGPALMAFLPLVIEYDAVTLVSFS